MMKKALYFLAINFLLSVSAKADHLFGADITFKCLGSNQYQVSVMFYRDCFGTLPPPTLTLNVTNVCGAVPVSYTLNQTIAGRVPLSTNCYGNTCDSTGINPGVDKTEFTTIITLADTCHSWFASVDVGTRTTYVNIFDHTTTHQLYIETIINNTVGCDDSPTFNEPQFMSCLDTQNCYRAGTPGPGDSTVWNFVAPKENANQFVPYLPGYSIQYPMDILTPLTLDTAGNFCFNTPTQLWTNITIQASNYRNGILTGQSMRDMSMLLLDCSIGPVLTGINGNINTDTVACINTMMCYNIFSTGLHSFDSTYLSWDSGIFGSFIIYPGLNESATFCWTPQLSDTGNNCYTAYVSQAGCPGTRRSQKNYCVTVLDSAACAIFLNANEINSKDEIKLFPQPVTNILNINFEKYNSKYSLAIYDINGRKVKELNNLSGASTVLPIENLLNGVYHLQIINSDNSRIWNGKFVKTN